MRYPEAIGWLYALAPRGMRYELDRMEAVVALRGHPERRVPAVHVAGTNGKGSVTTLVAAALRAGGLRTGLFTSPHLHRFPERIQVAGRPVGEAEVARRLTEIRRFLETPGTPPLSFFEVATLLAFEIFAAREVDVAVYEVGLGGRLDATNVLVPEVTGITRIALDHMRILGPDIPSIAREKAGIGKPGVPLVCGVRDPLAVEAIAGRARELGVPDPWWIDRDFQGLASASATGRSRPRVDLRVRRRVLREVPLRLAGAHQRDNAATAAALVTALGRRRRRLRVDDEAIRRGFARARWPGRLERLPGRPPVLLDAAHNHDGSAALAAHLRDGPGRRGVRGRVVLVFGVLEDKQGDEMAESLLPAVDAVVWVTPPVDRGRPAGDLAALFGGRVAKSVPEALSLARRRAGPEGLVVVAGSLFLVAAARARLLRLPAEPAVRG
ncbi:MAG TPA: folylpolyglutamate synthase/dihydrofolate synthase family protein [Polyangiaceae bacterium LLY-WYZ-14_1]|nr:folylpolyglutamate synthase/dihydrofolate synthase family protein [Polyangiaceae bacterium LLY-WYZ-14_1]